MLFPSSQMNMPKAGKYQKYFLARCQTCNETGCKFLLWDSFNYSTSMGLHITITETLLHAIEKWFSEASKLCGSTGLSLWKIFSNWFGFCQGKLFGFIESCSQNFFYRELVWLMTWKVNTYPKLIQISASNRNFQQFISFHSFFYFYVIKFIRSKKKLYPWRKTREKFLCARYFGS